MSAEWKALCTQNNSLTTDLSEEDKSVNIMKIITLLVATYKV